MKYNPESYDRFFTNYKVQGEIFTTFTAIRIEITPSGAALGAVDTGVNTSITADSEAILQLKQAWRDRHILIFKNQQLTDDQLLL
ncbi:hypothetical protein [Nostoc sp.]|uniref:hypothetical protein n=1 Tax=Nostoc sp. TaxID=1180 RepID=UPI002FF66D67